MKIRIIQLFCLFVFWINVQASAQIGYQVSLLNSATGEPRVHATVNAQVTLTNSLDEIILTENKSVTSNDFGVLSFTIGDENTLKDVDWNKLPFHISVKVDGVLIGKSQVLSVPVAEYAKQSGAVITKEMLMGKTWKYHRTYTDEGGEYRTDATLSFGGNKCTYSYYSYFNGVLEGYRTIIKDGTYQIFNGKIYCFFDNYTCWLLEYLPMNKALFADSDGWIFYAE